MKKENKKTQGSIQVLELCPNEFEGLLKAKYKKLLLKDSKKTKLHDTVVITEIDRYSKAATGRQETFSIYEIRQLKGLLSGYSLTYLKLKAPINQPNENLK